MSMTDRISTLNTLLWLIYIKYFAKVHVMKRCSKVSYYKPSLRMETLTLLTGCTYYTIHTENIFIPLHYGIFVLHIHCSLLMIVVNRNLDTSRPQDTIVVTIFAPLAYCHIDIKLGKVQKNNKNYKILVECVHLIL